MNAIDSPTVAFGQLPEELRTLAERALANARRELEKTGKLKPAVFFRLPNGSIDNLGIPPAALSLYEDDGHGRTLYFRTLRYAAEQMHATAVVMTNDMWTGKSTPKMMALPHDEVQRILDAHPAIEDLAKRGLMTRHEAVMVTVQTPEQVAMIEQLYRRDNKRRRITWEERTARCFPQENFDGRMRMYGKVKDAATH